MISINKKSKPTRSDITSFIAVCEHKRVAITSLPKYRIKVTLTLYLCQHISQVVKRQKFYTDWVSLRDRPATL